MSLLPLRVGGPPDRLVDAIQRWSDEYTEELVTDLARCRPGYVVPFADGFVYRDAGINAWHFPLPDDVFLMRAAREGIPGSPCRPGTRYLVRHGGVAVNTADGELVTLCSDDKWSRAFDPQVRLSDIPMSCKDWNRGLHDYMEDSSSRGILEKLQGRIARNLASVADDEQPSWRTEILPLINNWFLQLCDRPDEFQYLYAEWIEGTGWAVRYENIRPARREYGIRLHGS